MPTFFLIEWNGEKSKKKSRERREVARVANFLQENDEKGNFFDFRMKLKDSKNFLFKLKGKNRLKIAKNNIQFKSYYSFLKTNLVKPKFQ